MAEAAANHERPAEGFDCVLGRIGDATATDADQAGNGEHGCSRHTHTGILQGPGAGLLEARPRAVGGRRARRLKKAQPRDHQPIRLARERGREDRVAFRIARQLLRERNQFLPLEWCKSGCGLHLKLIMIAQTVSIGNLYYTFPP